MKSSWQNTDCTGIYHNEILDGRRQVETIKTPPGYGFLLVIEFSLYAASARVAPGKSGEWDIQKSLQSGMERGRGGRGGRRPGYCSVCQPGFNL